jgi:hypothetical protein
MTAIVKATSFCGSLPWRWKAERVGEPAQQASACVADRPSPDPRSSAKPSWMRAAAFHGAQEAIAPRDLMANPRFQVNVKGTPMQEPATDEVLIRREGRAGRITMNRPQALNALTLAMVDRIWEALLAWKSDPAVELVLLDGAGDRALCAGWRRARPLRQPGGRDRRSRAPSGRNEYPLNALIGRYPKPYVAIQDGIVMGGGIGLSGHARHRIVTERSRLAMPETGIGLIPDVGGTWLLAHAPGAVGVYLG